LLVVAAAGALVAAGASQAAGGPVSIDFQDGLVADFGLVTTQYAASTGVELGAKDSLGFPGGAKPLALPLGPARAIPFQVTRKR
jgi:hypothetical protein